MFQLFEQINAQENHGAQGQVNFQSVRIGTGWLLEVELGTCLRTAQDLGGTQQPREGTQQYRYHHLTPHSGLLFGVIFIFNCNKYCYFQRSYKRICVCAYIFFYFFGNEIARNETHEPCQHMKQLSPQRMQVSLFWSQTLPWTRNTELYYSKILCSNRVTVLSRFF